MNSIKVKAPAKINLFLEVAERKEDNFHSLRTVFQAIDVADAVELKKAEKDISLVNDWPELPNSKSNLCWKAAALLKRSQGIEQGVEIVLHKEIPVGAGLGGGSSDAAATLLGLNALWELGLSRQHLQLLSARLGSDVTFFLQGGTQIGEGRGEKLSPLGKNNLHLVISWPRVLLPTAAVYADWDRQPSSGSISWADFLSAWHKGKAEAIAACFRNDLQEAAERLCPVCRELRQELLAAGCRGAMVSGSGSAVFGLTDSAEQAEEIAGAIKSRRPDFWIKPAESLAGGAQPLL